MTTNDGERFKILIVDDEKSNLDVLIHILKASHTLLIAKSGEAAVRLAKEHIPDLILLDIVLPDMTGFEVLSELKSSNLTQGIPVIFITGLDSAENEETGFSLGAVDYITKPFHNSIVKARVKTHLQIVMQMRTIERLSMMDTLTVLPNRRNFDIRLEAEWKRAIRERIPISLLMVDLDQFKGYNDRYGHSQGDVLLQVTAGIFRQSLKRAADFISRWGGDEFAVLLPNTDLNGALEIAGQMRANMEGAEIPCPEGICSPITISIGVNSKVPMPDDSAADFISQADKALYDAKGTGRNRVCS